MHVALGSHGDCSVHSSTSTGVVYLGSKEHKNKYVRTYACFGIEVLSSNIKDNLLYVRAIGSSREYLTIVVN